MWWRSSEKYSAVRMSLNLSDHQIITGCYIHRLSSKNSMVTMNQKIITDTQKTKTKRREPNHNTKENHKIQKTTRGIQDQKTKTTRFNKMAISTLISIITLNVNGLSVSVK